MSHTQSLHDVMKLAGQMRCGDAAGESRRKSAILNDALSAAGVFWAFKSYPTRSADRVVIQFRAEGADQVVEVDAARFLAFLKDNHSFHQIRAALVRKLEAARAKIHP